MPKRDIVAVGASLGGVDALRRLCATLPADLDAAVFVVLHLSPSTPSLLPEILTRAGPLPAEQARDHMAFQHGRIYVAPPDLHLRLDKDGMRLSHGARENYQRPAVDALFRSAAAAYGARVIGVVLTGALDCGTAGLHAIKRRGGVAVVQDPKDAECPDMPQSAIENVKIDHVAKVDALGPLLARLVLDGGPAPSEPEAVEAVVAGKTFSCPSCGGVLKPGQDLESTELVCQVGHAYSPIALESGQAQTLEGALWTALRTLEEQAELSRTLARRAEHRQHQMTQRRFEEKAQTADSQARLIRQALHLQARSK